MKKKIEFIKYGVYVLLFLLSYSMSYEVVEDVKLAFIIASAFMFWLALFIQFASWGIQLIEKKLTINNTLI